MSRISDRKKAGFLVLKLAWGLAHFDEEYTIKNGQDFYDIQYYIDEAGVSGIQPNKERDRQNRQIYNRNLYQSEEKNTKNGQKVCNIGQLEFFDRWRQHYM